MSDDYMNIQQAANYLGYAVGTLRNLRSHDQGPRSVKFAGRVHYSRADLDAWRDWYAAQTARGEFA